MSHPVGCPGYDPERDGEAAKTNCSKLALDSVRCRFPLCPMPNSTESILSFNQDLHIVVSMDEDEDTSPLEVGKKVTFSCEEDCKNDILT